MAVAVLSAIAPSLAGERYRREWSDHPGMPHRVLDLDYDDRGFLWLAGEEGIHRFDGQEVVPWSERRVRDVVGINRGPGGRLVAFTEQGECYEVTPAGVDDLDEAGGARLGFVHDADYGPEGALWVGDDTGLFRRGPAGDWTRIELPHAERSIPIRVRGAPDGGAFVGTNGGAFVRVHPNGTAETMWSESTGQVTRIAVKDRRTQAFCLRFGLRHGVYLVQDGVVRAVYRPPPESRWTGLTFRDDTLWAVSVDEVVAISSDGAHVERLGPAEGFYTGGEAIVDHEKSLWLTSFRGVFQFTEPDVELETEMDGTREIHHVGSDIVVGRWRGPHRRSTDGAWRPMTPPGYEIFGVGGVSPWSSLWFVAVKAPRTSHNESALLEFDRGRWTERLRESYGVFDGAYHADEQGTFWIGFHNHLWRVDARGSTPRAVAKLPFDKPVLVGLHVEDGRVRMAFRFQAAYCEARLNTARDALDTGWDCETIEGARELLDFLVVDGETWLATWDRGVVRRGHDGWETIVGDDELGTPTVRGISRSQSGGVWVISYLGRIRVELQGDEARVVERLGPWNGVPVWMTFGAREQPDGTVWLSGMTSAIRIPPRARRRPTEAPRVFVTGFRADGRELSPGTVHELPATTSRIELRWSAPAYRDPASLRFQVRSDSGDEWVTTRERSFRFVNLAAGDYRIEVRASLDGETWSAEPADFRFSIRSPLWRRPVTWAGLLAVVAVAVVLLQWLRTRQQIRLERQRTDIAMNLHDELGAGLASIGLLTDLAADGEMEAGEGREAVVRVGEISRALSRSLSDIVWTLRPKSVDMAGFALFLRQRAADLLSSGESVVEFDIPDPVPEVPLPLEVRRQVHAIASEALHNAAKHAQASKVSVALRPQQDLWVLRITDDGGGFGATPSTDGLGLESMRQRAACIGADLSIESRVGEGCRVELRFAPGGGRADERK